MKCMIAALPLLIGFILDALIGDPYSLPHPVRLTGKMIGKLESVIRRTMPRNEQAGGTILVIITLALSAAVPLILLILSYRLNLWLGTAVESVMCFYLLAAKSLKTESMKVYYAIKDKDIEKARRAVSMIVGRDTDKLGERGIIKAAVETVAENTSDGVIAPMLYTALFGAVGGFVYKAANTMDSMLGYTNEKYIRFGRCAAKTDDILNYIPSRLSAVLMIISAYLLRYDGKNAVKIWRRDRRKHKSPNAAQTESVCAGALDIALAGDAYYFGALSKKPIIGDDIRPVENEDIRRANRLMYRSAFLALIVTAAARIILWGVILL